MVYVRFGTGVPYNMKEKIKIIFFFKSKFEKSLQKHLKNR